MNEKNVVNSNQIISGFGNKIKKHDEQFINIGEQAILNAKNYGFIGDGVTLNDDVMEIFINNKSDHVLYFTKGVYLFSKPFNFDDNMFIKADGDVEFKLQSDTIHEYFITLRKDSTKSDYAINNYIEGVKINCNYCANTAISPYKTLMFRGENLTIKNVNKCGIKTRPSTTPDGNSFFKNILLENDEGKTGTYAVYDNGFDNVFENIEAVNFEIGYYTIAGRFDNVKAWIRDNLLIPNSTFAIIDGYDVTFSNIAVDTYRKGFKLLTSVSSVLINNMLWLTNNGVYTSELQSQYPRTIFVAEYPDRIIKLNGLKINDESSLTFIDVNSPNSSFLNVRVPYGFDAYKNITRFRNDNDKLQNISGLLGNPSTETINKSSNLNDVTKIGLYTMNLWEGSGGSNYPDIQDLGVLEVMNSNKSTYNIIVQKFYGIYYYAHRVYVAGAWQDWKTIRFTE